ncbi:MAG: HAMP domain-containing histidine kinase [Burkholderiales bacterium]|nr:HAMP domain-containing histidine kinase [Bacteroidia bacterium]
MKLITKTITYYLLISIPLLLLAVMFSYYRIKVQLNEEIEESLYKEALHAETLATSVKPNDLKLDFSNLSSIKSSAPHENSHTFYDTSIYNQLEHELVPYRMLKSYINWEGQTYLITNVKSTLEDDDLMESLYSVCVMIIGFLILAFFIVSWLLSKILWRPFYATLSRLNEYDIKQHKPYQFDKSSTAEFNQLNTALNKMTDKMYHDFLHQKEFAENASHEMQTPLAVIKANLSLLLQSPNLKENEMNQLQSIENTIKKLSALNKALILLSKIENNQFNENSSVNLNDKIKAAIENYQDLIQAKNIKIETELSNDLIIRINPALCEILIANLLQNAIRHNYMNGTIEISIKNETLLIANTGETLSISEDELFVRFKKNDAAKDSLGLGLSIVKSIVTLYNTQIQYLYSLNKHIFTLKF